MAKPITIIALTITILTTACNSTRDPIDISDPPTQPTANADADPYDTYLELAPPDAPDLTRDDAQARALLGCDTAWATGTTDWALQQAYGDRLCQ